MHRVHPPGPIVWLVAFILGGSFGGVRAARAQVSPAEIVPAVETRPDELAPGMWVRYALVNRANGKAILVRLAALQREKGGQWFEVEITDERQRTMVFKSLVLGPVTRPKKIVRAIVQPPGQRPLLLPPKLSRVQLPRLRTRYRKLKAARRGPIKVPAGTFRARYFRHGEGDALQEVWVSDALRGWPLVKYRSPQVVLELIARGKDAQSKVRGQPIKLNQSLLRQLGLID